MLESSTPEPLLQRAMRRCIALCASKAGLMIAGGLDESSPYNTDFSRAVGITCRERLYPFASIRVYLRLLFKGNPMHLYFLRHGKAEEHTDDKSDRERRLVQRGINDTTVLAARLKILTVSFDTIFTSPYPRAAETAAIVAEALGLSARLTESEALAAGRFGMGSLQTLTARQGANSTLLFVGHEPDLSEIVERLTGGVCEMKTACLAYVEADRAEPGRGILQWLLPPKLLAPLS